MTDEEEVERQMVGQSNEQNERSESEKEAVEGTVNSCRLSYSLQQLKFEQSRQLRQQQTTMMMKKMMKQKRRQHEP